MELRDLRQLAQCSSLVEKVAELKTGHVSGGGTDCSDWWPSEEGVRSALAGEGEEGAHREMRRGSDA